MTDRHHDAVRAECLDDVERAVRAASSRPAALLGDTVRGRLTPGGAGDAVVLTPELDLVATVVAGEILHHRP